MSFRSPMPVRYRGFTISPVAARWQISYGGTPVAPGRTFGSVDEAKRWLDRHA